MNEEMSWLLETGRLTLNEEDESRYFNAEQWGSPLSAAKDAALVFYEIRKNKEGIADISFNFVENGVFRATYEILES